MNYSGNVRKDNETKKSSWMYVVEMGKHSNGKRKQSRNRGFKTKKEAQAALTKKIHELNSGTYVEPSKEPLSDYLARWIENKKPHINASTYDNYECNLKNHILPELGGSSLYEVRASHIEDFYSKLLSEKQLSPSTVKKIHSMLSNAFEKAVKHELIVKNPVRLVEVPKEIPIEMEVWTAKEVRTFLHYANSSPFHIVYAVAIDTGMRMGEILGLPWKNVDLEHQQIHVNQKLAKDGKTIEHFLKTKTGKRTIEISPELNEKLRKHQLTQRERQLKYGHTLPDHGLINTTTIGTPIHSSNLRRDFNKLIQQAKLKKIRFHDLRHTHATLLLSQNAHMKVVSERLGHTSTRMTIDRYSHLLPNMQRETTRQFAKMLYSDVSS